MLLADCASAASAPQTARAAPRPNIILVTLDTTRADRMGFLGSNLGLTPNLDALAHESVVFSHSYAHVPLTPPSHATILTGTYPQFNHLQYMGEPLTKDLPYLPDILRRRGYRTAAFVGSMILDPKNVTAFGFERGFGTYDAGFHQRKAGEDRYKSVERRAGEVVQRALTWLGKQTGGPFFLWVHCYDPHGPYDPPEPYKGRFKDGYDGEIAYTDAAMGKLFGGLRARGLYDNSMIVVTADHGEAFGEHGEEHHGIFLYDETMHVPLLIKFPKGAWAGKRVDTRVRLVDIAPTMLQVARMAVPAAMQGESLVSLVNAQGATTAAGRTSVDRPAYGETIYAHRAFGWSVLRSWRSGKYLYVQAPKRELYDQSTDPQADHNIEAASKAVADTLAAQLEGFREKTSSAGTGATNLDPEQAENLRALGYLPSTTTAASASDEGGPDPKDHIEIANLLTDALFDVQEERYEEAIPKLEKVLAQEPNTNLAYLELGRAYLRLQQPDKALPLLRKAAEKLPDDGSARYELGKALVETNNWAEAAPQFEAAIAKTPQSYALHFYLAVVYERTQRIPEAMKEFQTTIKLKPDHFRANLLLGRLYGMQGNGAAALPYLLQAAKIDPKSAEAHMFLANVYSELGQEANARRERDLVERQKASENR
ncbi:MAG TPA: sulfatase-like hydrolase/transferase [Terriglobales bacterium]|nr:sulfatase-like hydrolase/transferase [Terriglobales bacterium]